MLKVLSKTFWELPDADPSWRVAWLAGGGRVINDAAVGAAVLQWAAAAQSLLIRCNSSAQQQKQ